MLLRLDFFLGNQIHLGVNDNLFYYTAAVSSAAWPAQRAPRAYIAERRAGLLPRLLRRVRSSGQEQRAGAALPKVAGKPRRAWPLCRHAGCLWLPDKGGEEPPGLPSARARTCFREQRRGSAGHTDNFGVGAWGHLRRETDRLLSAE